MELMQEKVIVSQHLTGASYMDDGFIAAFVNSGKLDPSAKYHVHFRRRFALLKEVGVPLHLRGAVVFDETIQDRCVQTG
jgi:hypothetical protein